MVDMIGDVMNATLYFMLNAPFEEKRTFNVTQNSEKMNQND